MCISIETTANDDPDFFAQITQVLTGAIKIDQPEQIRIVRIDRWFGPRWLGFEGKILGIAGVRSKPQSEKPWLRIPPFHPHRVFESHYYERSDNGYYHRLLPRKWIHGYRTSESNTRLRLLEAGGPGLYAWISGDSRACACGALMVYLIHAESEAGWYVGFKKEAHWVVCRRLGIGEPELRIIHAAAEQPCKVLDKRMEQIATIEKRMEQRYWSGVE